MKTAIYPGSFDPVTLGHLNIIKRAAKAFDQLIVCVLVNSEKHGIFSAEERVELLRRAISLENVEVDMYSGLLANYAKQRDARVLVKGLRAFSDFEAEVQMAIINNKLNPDLDTVFFPSSQKFNYLSSTVAKELARYDVNLEEILPREIIEDVRRKMEEKRGACDGK
ncbi:MAG: Phosphopantetheine adenylyltransferase [Evtepia sp.]|jgi:pantetheine-phosphate adenylyltransferase|nr:Phosphopantetheine adenylyltransferase [Evtepia sp.]